MLSFLGDCTVKGRSGPCTHLEMSRLFSLSSLARTSDILYIYFMTALYKFGTMIVYFTLLLYYTCIKCFNNISWLLVKGSLTCCELDAEEEKAIWPSG